MNRAAKVFNGTFTITSFVRSNGQHRTFRIKTVRAEDHPLNGKRIVSLLSGPDNTRDYKGFAFIDDSGIHVWKKYQDSKVFRAYADLLWDMAANGENSRYIPLGYTIQESLHCTRCNKKLTTPESLATGIGPICDGRV